ncbi:MAG: VWA domain-containing protein [Methanomassiliicoccales archaeon]|nr:MAG: VWA domain-containing protein [Methanomassiliicoccales archaeon]
MILPDCDVFDDSLVLSYKENIELITKLIEEGPQYLDKFVDEQKKKDSAVAKYIRRLRKRLERQAESIRSERKKGYMQKLRALQKNREARMKQTQTEMLKLTDEQKLLQDRLNEILENALLGDDFVKLVIDSPLDLEEEEQGLMKRILAGIIRFFMRIGGAIKRFFIWLSRKLRRAKPLAEEEQELKRPKLLFSFPAIAGNLDDIDSKFGNALFTSPNLRSEMEKDMLKKKRFRRSRLSWRKRFKKTKYVEDAKRAFYDRLEKKMKKKVEKVKAKQKALSEKAKDLKVQEKHVNAETKEEEKRLKAQRKREEEQIRKQLSSVPKEKAKSKVTEKLEYSGYITRKEGELNITSQLVDRFADIVFSAEISNLPMAYHAIYGASDVEGIYERGRLRMIDEISRMDIVESMVNARIRHPYDTHIYEDDVITYRDKRGANNHVILMFDKSGSMDENDRIQAAKKAVLALYKAVKERNPRNIVDLVAFDTKVEVMDLLEVWKSEAKGFTNTGEAIKTARTLLQESSADRKLVYLITDGLPEAYTENEEVFAGDTDKSLNYAISQAKELSYVQDVHLTMVLLEAKEKIYLDAAQRIVSASNGKAVIVEPQELAAEMIMDFVAL